MIHNCGIWLCLKDEDQDEWEAIICFQGLCIFYCLVRLVWPILVESSLEIVIGWLV